MSFLPSLPPNAVLLDVFKAFPGPAMPLLEYHQVLMRGPSPFSTGERELIAAYVSGLNACRYCHGVHQATAEALGVSEGLVSALLSDLAAAPISERMKPVLRYVRRLTETPSRVTEADARAILHAGWDERALYHAASVCALFSLMNRVVDGLGISAGPAYFALASERLSAHGYTGLLRLLEKRDD